MPGPTPPYVIDALYAAVAAVSPHLDTLCPSDPNDKSTWKIYYSAGVTAAEQAAVAGVVAAFDPAKVPVPAPIGDALLAHIAAIYGVPEAAVRARLKTALGV
jgi:hypothetical protein